jgi:hypothetical protein
MRRIRSAFWVTSAAIALALLAGRIFYRGLRSLDAEFLVSTALVALAAGLPIGLFIRDVVFYHDSGAGLWRKQTGRLIRLVLYLANRFPRVGRGWQSRRRAKIRAQPFPAEWLPVLESRLPLYRRLPTADQEELQRQIMVFLEEKRFEGCGSR